MKDKCLRTSISVELHIDAIEPRDVIIFHVLINGFDDD